MAVKKGTTMIGYSSPSVPRKGRKWGCLCCDRTFASSRAARVHFFRAVKREWTRGKSIAVSPHYKHVYWPEPAARFME